MLTLAARELRQVCRTGREELINHLFDLPQSQHCAGQRIERDCPPHGIPISLQRPFFRSEALARRECLSAGAERIPSCLLQS